MSKTINPPAWLSRIIVEPLAMPTARARALIKSLLSLPANVPAIFDDDDDPFGGGGDDDCVAGYSVANGVATIPIIGVLTKYPSFPSWIDKYYGFVPSQTIRVSIEKALADRTVQAIDFQIDCPGGLYAGTNELGDYIAKINGTGEGQKPCYARVSDLAASGGYWIASQCSRITCNPGGFTGCIGVYTVLLDDSKFWAEMGISWELISSGGVKGLGADGKVTPELKSDVQREVDAMFDRFIGAVAAGRKMTPAQAKTLGDGRVWMSNEAINLGLIDEALSVEDSLAAILTEVGTMPITPQQFTEHAAANPAATEVQSLINQGKEQVSKAPATASELKSLIPGDSDFALSQLESGATLATAATAGCKRLTEQLATAKSDLAAAKTAHAGEISALKETHAKEIEKAAFNQGTQPPVATRTKEEPKTQQGDEGDDVEVAAKAEWAKMSKDEKSAWLDENTFVAYEKAEATGRVKTTKVA